MTDKQWKRTERVIARRLGGQRIPVSGRGRGDAPDIEHAWLCPEVKSWKAFPFWLRDAMAQAKAAARPEQLPIVVLHALNTYHDKDLVIMTLRDFEDWHGRAEKQEGDHD